MAPRTKPCSLCSGKNMKCVEECPGRAFLPKSKKELHDAMDDVFGAKMIMKKRVFGLESPEERAAAFASVEWETREWENDKVNGPYGAFVKQEALFKSQIHALEKVIEALKVSSTGTEGHLIAAGLDRDVQLAEKIKDIETEVKLHSNKVESMLGEMKKVVSILV